MKIAQNSSLTYSAVLPLLKIQRTVSNSIRQKRISYRSTGNLSVQQYSVSLTDDAENDIAELMAFYDELVDEESAEKFFAEAMETIAKLEYLPHANAELPSMPEARKIQMQTHKVAIIYIVDDNIFEVVAVRAYHQMQNPEEYQKSIRERIDKMNVNHKE